MENIIFDSRSLIVLGTEKTHHSVLKKEITSVSVIDSREIMKKYADSASRDGTPRFIMIIEILRNAFAARANLELIVMHQPSSGRYVGRLLNFPL